MFVPKLSGLLAYITMLFIQNLERICLQDFFPRIKITVVFGPKLQVSYLVYGAHISMLFILKSSSCVFNQYFLSGQKYREYYVPLKMPEYI